jgi:hypothetical protein
MKSGEVFDLLRATFRLPEWAFFAEVRTRTGYSKTFHRDADSERYIDGLALSMYPSKDFERRAFEIKISRGDWLREKDDLRKRSFAYYFSHRFYYVFGEPGIWQPKDDGPMLDGIGVYEVVDGQLVLKREALLRDPFPIPETFVASLLRHALQVTLPPSELPPEPPVKAPPPNGGLFDSIDFDLESITQN